MKRFLSFCLTVVMLIGCMQISFAATENDNDSVQLEIANETSFAWGDEITFTVTITNGTGSRITAVNLRSEPKGMSRFFSQTSDSAPSIEYITPGANRTVEIKYTSQSISSVRSFFRSIASFFLRVFVRFSRSYTETRLVKVGYSNILFGIDVDYETSQQSTASEINLDDPDPDVEIFSFKADTFDIRVGESKNVIFYAEIFENIELGSTDVCVVDESNNIIAYLKDDGIRPDLQKNDGVFTASATLKSDERDNVKYYAKYNNLSSDDFEICFYTDISNEEYGKAVDVIQHINSLLSLEAVKSYLSHSSEIETYSVNESDGTAYYSTTSGISGVWEKKENNGLKGNKAEKSGYYPIGSVSPVSASDAYVVTASNKNVAVIRPYIGSDPNFTQVSQETGRTIAAALGGSCTVVDDQNVTLSFMKTLQNYGTVIVDSHGTLAMYSDASNDTSEDPYMVIGETISTSTRYSDADWQSSRIVVTGGNRIAIGGGFFERYYSEGSFQDTVFYLGTCYSIHNETIASALLSKGASAVYGFSEPVGFTYCDNILTAVFTSLITNKQNVQQAYSAAGDEHGYTYGGNCEFRVRRASLFSYYSLETGKISGVIKNAANSSAVSNALIRVYKNDELIASTRTNSSGSYTISLPSGSYIVKVSAGGFKTAKMAVTVRKDATTWNETFLLISSGLTSGYANGSTINAITGQLLPDVRINIRSSWNNYEGQIIETTISNDRGYYEVSLPAGLYTFECYKDGFITTYKNILVFVMDYAAQNISVAPELEEGYYRVVLTWGQDPSDLDSHLFGKTSDYNYHVYYSNKNGVGLEDAVVANLDVDDTTSFGPETTTFLTTTDGEYDFYVDWYSGSGTWASSGGKVEVYNGAYLINTYYAPNVSNRSGSWKVFSIKNGIYTDYNVISEDIY